VLMCVLPVKETGTDLLSQHGVPLLLVYSPHLLWQVNETAMDAPDDEMKEVNINNMSALSTEARCACARRTRTRAQGHVYKDTCTRTRAPLLRGASALSTEARCAWWCGCARAWPASDAGEATMAWRSGHVRATGDGGAACCDDAVGE
jgi:hypothetical protein